MKKVTFKMQNLKWIAQTESLNCKDGIKNNNGNTKREKSNIKLKRKMENLKWKNLKSSKNGRQSAI